MFCSDLIGWLLRSLDSQEHATWNDMMKCSTAQGNTLNTLGTTQSMCPCVSEWADNRIWIKGATITWWCVCQNKMPLYLCWTVTTLQLLENTSLPFTETPLVVKAKRTDSKHRLFFYFPLRRVLANYPNTPLRASKGWLQWAGKGRTTNWIYTLNIFLRILRSCLRYPFGWLIIHFPILNIKNRCLFSQPLNEYLYISFQAQRRNNAKFVS